MLFYYSRNIKLFSEESNKLFTKITIQEILKKLENETELALDCETTGLDYLNDRVIMLQLGTKTDQYVIDTRDLDISVFKPLLHLNNTLFIGHNIKFDYNMLKQYGIVLNNVYDTMTADMVIHNGKYSMKELRDTRRFSLKGVYHFYFKKYISKEVREEFTTWGSTPFTDDQIKYGAWDVVYPLEIKKVQEELIELYALKKTINLENKVILALGDMEYNGMKIDRKKWAKIDEIYKKRLKDTIIELDNILIEKDNSFKIKAVQLDLFSGIASSERLTYINWSSDQQVYRLLTTIFKIYPEDKDGKQSSSSKALELLDIETKELPIVKTLLRFRKEDKIISSFGQKYLNENLKTDGRLHTTYNSIVATGRVSSRNPLYRGALYCKVYRITG